MILKTKKKIALFFLVGSLLPGCQQLKKYYNRNRLHLKRSFFTGPIKEGSITLFIHGTKSSFISRFIHKTDYTYGINPILLSRSKSVLTNIARTLNEANKQEYPLDSFYFYSWEGQLTFSSRLKAAEKLYPILKNHTGPITIITHSHGANVALNLAYWAEKNNDCTFKIDRLIMLAPPVQEVTKPYAYSGIFKEIYNFYSTADFMQIGDTQGLYSESYKRTKPGTKIPFFSERTFKSAPHIFQTRILLDDQSPGHLPFLLSRFIRKLPLLLTLTQDAACSAPENSFIINIPRGNQPPYLVDPCRLKNSYIPRSRYQKNLDYAEAYQKSSEKCSDFANSAKIGS